MTHTFDITVIGSGPGGYTAAIRAAQLGYRVAIVEKYPTLGGTCTNVGCIPSKALLDSTEHYHNAVHKFARHGIITGKLDIDFTQLMNRKNQVVRQNTDGIQFLMKKNRIQVFRGMGSFVNPTLLKVSGEEEHQISSRYFIIATGSKPSSLPGVQPDGERIITSTEALSLGERPESLAIIGGGVIGVELASVFARLGTRVTILEYADTLIPTMDRDLGRELGKVMRRDGISILLEQQVKQVTRRDKGVSIVHAGKQGEEQITEAACCLVAVGRRPYTDGLGLENTGVRTDEKGRILVNERLQTGEPAIYAIGDVVRGAMLAHKAEEEGVFVAEAIHGGKPHINYNLIPGVVYTWPEVAAVGSTEEELKAKGIPYRTGRFPFLASGRARAAMEQDGFVKVISDPRYGEILGVHIIGPRAADLVAQAVIGMEYEVTDEDMFRISYAHPTYSEALKEAYLEASGQGSLNL